VPVDVIYHCFLVFIRPVKTRAYYGLPHIMLTGTLYTMSTKSQSFSIILVRTDKLY